MRYQRAEPPLKLDGLAAARQFFEDCLAEQDPGLEALWVAHLDHQSCCMHVSRHQGRVDGMPLPLREIILDAAHHDSAGLVIAHNHPSGDARPSESDLAATRRLAAAAELVDCQLLDHLVFGSGECTSMRALGYL